MRTISLRCRVLMLLAAVVVIGWQSWTMHDRPRNSFLLSYWFVTWDYGFVRRGLLGEINQLLFGADLRSGAIVLSWAVAILSAGVVAALALALIWRGTPLMIGVGWLLIVSPFTIKGMLNYARPDQLAVPLLLIVGLVLLPTVRRVRGMRHVWVPLTALGGVFAVLILGHEGIVLAIAPWILVLIVALSPQQPLRAILGRLAAFLAAPALTTLAVLDRGVATSKQVTLLEDAIEPYVPRGNTMINYLDDTTAESIEMVARFGARNLAIMVAVGLGLWLLHALAAAWVPNLPWRVPRRVTIGLLLFVLPAMAVQFAIAVDWQRWFSLYLAVGLVTLGIGLLVRPVSETTNWQPVRIIAFVVACCLLTLVPISTANNKYPCSVEYLVRQAPYPFEKVEDAVTGEQERYPLPKCRG